MIKSAYYYYFQMPWLPELMFTINDFKVSIWKVEPLACIINGKMCLAELNDMFLMHLHFSDYFWDCEKCILIYLKYLSFSPFMWRHPWWPMSMIKKNTRVQPQQ